MQDNISVFPSPSAAEADQASNHLHTRLHNLPAQLTPLIGREHEVEVGCTLLRRPEIRLVTLTGTGGVGKTRLGLHIAEELLDEFADDVYFIPFAPISDPNLVIPTVAQAFDLKETPDWSPLEHLKASLHEKQCLLLLDNFEQLVTAAPLLVELLQACPHLKILVTSRAVLHISGEHEFLVPPLAVPDQKHLPESEALTRYAAVSLFVQRASAIKPEFRVMQANTRTIAEICIRLDGLPLAIELAAARIKLLSPQALLLRLSRRLQVLTGGVRDAPVRQQALRNTLAWSYDLLSPEEQRLFRRLAAFAGGCTLEAAEAVGNAANDLRMDVLEGVASLLDKSLLQQVEQANGEPRLVMLETIREYGLECLVESGELEATRQAHVTYYLTLAEKVEPELNGSQQVMWLEQLEQEHDNLRATMQWSLEQGEAGHYREMALRLGGTLGKFWSIRGYWSEGRTFLEHVLRESAEVAAPVRAKALSTAANLTRRQGDADQAEILAEESLRLYQEIRDTRGIASSFFLLAGVAWSRDNLAAVSSLTEKSLALFREVGDKEGIAWALLNLADLARIQGKPTEGCTLYEESVMLFRELGDKRSTASSLFGLAYLIFEFQGDQAAVHQLLEECLTLSREVGDKAEIAWALHFSGQVALQQGEMVKARSLFEESLMLFRDLGDRPSIAGLLSSLAKVVAVQGNQAAVCTLYEESLAVAREIDDKSLIALGLEGLAGVAAARGEPMRAARLWGTAEALRDTVDAPIPSLERVGYERAVAAARTQLGELAFIAAWTKGRTMTPEQALAAWGPVTISEEIINMPQPASAKASQAYSAGLTQREVEVLRLVAQGLTDAQVAEQLVISPRTVNWHLTSIYSKLQVSSRSAATRYAIEHKLV